MSDDPVVSRAQARVGQTLRGKWRLDGLLGIGGMAAVYAATHRNGARGAIKMLHLELSTDAKLRERFLREGYVANAVEHPGAVRALDDDVAEDGSVFLVMELLVGETVEHRRLRSGGQLAPDESLSVVDQLLSVLAAAHAKGVVHRDIKPDNLFLSDSGQLKLLDFGIARLRDGTTATTQAGSAMGTPVFMAPEQALGRSELIGPATDLWAAGAVLFSLMTGRYVHAGSTPNEVLIAAATREAPSLATAMHSAPGPLVALVDRALAFDASKRWASAAEMQAALRAAYQQITGRSSLPFVGGVVTSPGPARAGAGSAVPAASTRTDASASNARLSPWSSQPREAPSPKGWALAALALPLLGVGGWMLLHRPASAPPAPTQVEPPPSAPSAPAAASVAEPPRAEGKLRIETAGGACSLRIDGAAKGSTQALGEAIALDAGEHELVCDFGQGRVASQRVAIEAGATAKVKLQPSKASKPSAPAAAPAPQTVDPLDRRR